MTTNTSIEFSLVSLLRETAHQKGLTNDALARVSGVPFSTLQKVMTGTVEPRWSTVFRLASALGADISSLFAQNSAPVPSDKFVSAEFEDFHTRLRTLIVNAGGPKEVARKTGVSLASVYNYANLKAWPQTDWVLKLCKAADVAPAWLFGRDSTSPLPTPTTLDFRRYGKSQRIASNPDAIQSAEAFKLAIIALPVGKDIRARLTGKLDEHIALLREGAAA